MLPATEHAWVETACTPLVVLPVRAARQRLARCATAATSAAASMGLARKAS
jgi:hypothetical protein